jgi:hypothetical protein
MIAINPFKDAPGTGLLGEEDIANTFQPFKLSAVIADDNTQRLTAQHFLVVPGISADKDLP